MLNSPEARRRACGESAEVEESTHHQIRLLLVALVRLRPSVRITDALAELVPAVRLGAESGAVSSRGLCLCFPLDLLRFRHGRGT